MYVSTPLSPLSTMTSFYQLLLKVVALFCSHTLSSPQLLGSPRPPRIRHSYSRVSPWEHGIGTWSSWPVSPYNLP
ncbi:hypothetical protein CPB86DRAFT_87977 [Serendipita vermifera]|nr:hypothetical protein CPB86DRAFT_87977 [Serendipita vermifera]